MNLDRLNRWLVLLSNIGVLIGLYVLIAELNHSSRLAEVAAYQTRVSEMQNMQLELALSSDLPEILAKYRSRGRSSLSAAEDIRVRSFYGHILRQMQGQYYQYQSGFLERAVIDRTLQDIADGIYLHWEALDLLGNIEIGEWQAEIEHQIQHVNTSSD